MIQHPRIIPRLALAALLVGSGLAAAPAWAFSWPQHAPDTLAPRSSAVYVSAAKQDLLLDGSKTLIGKIADRGIGFLSDSSLSEQKRESEFRKLLNDSFDMKTIGRFALGRYWKNATNPQKNEYQKLFNELIVRVYTARFKEYDGQKLEVVGAKKDGAGKDVMVQSVIVPKNGDQKFTVEWRVREKDGAFKVVDILVEGVSMALTQRSDFASVIQRGGGNVDVLLEHLRK